MPYHLFSDTPDLQTKMFIFALVFVALALLRPKAMCHGDSDFDCLICRQTASSMLDTFLQSSYQPNTFDHVSYHVVRSPIMVSFFSINFESLH